MIQVVKQRGKSPSALIGACRLSYVFLDQPYTPEGGEGSKYMCTLLIPKSDTRAVEAIQSLIAEAKAYGKVTKWKQQIPRNLRTPLRDGDERENDPDGIYKGHWYICATSNRRVPVVDRNRLPVTNPDELYSGMWGVVLVAFSPYATTGNNGVGAYMNIVMKTRDDDRFGGGGVSANVFDAIHLEELDDDDL